MKATLIGLLLQDYFLTKILKNAPSQTYPSGLEKIYDFLCSIMNLEWPRLMPDPFRLEGRD